MIFETHTLDSNLSSHIESIFYYKDFKPDHSIERVVPTGHLFLLFELDGIERNTFDNETLKPNGNFSKVWISGLHKNYLSISAHQDSEMLVVQFKAHGGLPFLHLPIHELNDKVIPAEEILGAEILTLREEILIAADPNKKFSLVEEWMLGKSDFSKAPDEKLIQIITALKEQPTANFHEVITDYPFTQKHLIQQFKKYCGLTPKVFHRIFRFNEILQLIHQQQKISWSQIAYQCGYTDQSHFIKEFKTFSGFNPTEFIDRDFNQAEPNFFPID